MHTKKIQQPLGLEVERCIKHGSCFVPVIFSHRLPRVMKAFLPLVIVCAVGTVSGFPRLSRPQQHNGVQYEGPMKETEYGLENIQSKEEFEIKTADTLPWKLRNPNGPGKYLSDGLVNVESEEEFELKTADKVPWNRKGSMQMEYANAKFDSEEDYEARDRI